MLQLSGLDFSCCALSEVSAAIAVAELLAKRIAAC
jgi:hypothetical protein